MARAPMIDAIWAARTIERIEAQGFSVHESLDAAGLTRAAVMDPDGRIPMSRHTAFQEALARQIGDECFGIHNREHSRPSDAGPLGYLLMHAPTLGEALQNFIRYLKVHLDADTMLTIRGGAAHMSVTMCDTPPEECRHETEGGYVILLNTLRALLGPDWTPLEMQFAHSAPRDLSEHHRVFGARVLFDQPVNAMVIDAALLERPCTGRDNQLYRLMKRYIDDLLNRGAGDDPDEMIEQVRHLISDTLIRGKPSIASVAGQMAISPRTLQRRLRSKGVEFGKLADEVRGTLARGYLANRSLSLTQIAFLVGYAEISAFSRAFRRWTGMSPQEYRRSIRE